MPVIITKILALLVLAWASFKAYVINPFVHNYPEIAAVVLGGLALFIILRSIGFLIKLFIALAMVVILAYAAHQLFGFDIRWLTDLMPFADSPQQVVSNVVLLQK